MEIPIQYIIYLVIGLIFLTSGRRLFWLFTACIGFIIGFEHGGTLTGIQNQWGILIVAFFSGILGALLAVFLQGVAVCIAGFLVGGFAAVNLLQLLGYYSYQYHWLSFILGGVIGLILMIMIFDYALIFLSSIAGAFMIVHIFQLTSPGKSIVFLILAMAGAVFQARVHPQKDS